MHSAATPDDKYDQAEVGRGKEGTAPSVYRALILSLLDDGCQELECAPVDVLAKYCNIQKTNIHILLITAIHIMRI